MFCPPDELKKSEFLSYFLYYWYVINRYDTRQVYSVSNFKCYSLTIFYFFYFYSSLNCCVFQLEDIQKKVENLNAGGITWEDVCFR
jgi:hypothetical protein